MTPIAQTSTGFPWPSFLKISGGRRWHQRCECKTRRHEHAPGAMYPGVPHVVVSALYVCSSIILLNPKSAMSRSASSSLLLNRRFSGFKSAVLVSPPPFLSKSVGTDRGARCRRGGGS